MDPFRRDVMKEIEVTCLHSNLKLSQDLEVAAQDFLAVGLSTLFFLSVVVQLLVPCLNAVAACHPF